MSKKRTPSQVYADAVTAAPAAADGPTAPDTFGAPPLLTPQAVACDACACVWIDEAAGVERCVRFPPSPFAGGCVQPVLPASRRCFAGVPR